MGYNTTKKVCIGLGQTDEEGKKFAKFDNVEHRRYFPAEGKLEMLYVTGPAAFARATQTPGSGWKGRIHLPCHMGNHGPQLRTIWGSGSVLFVQDAKLHEGLGGAWSIHIRSSTR